jgi:hypothetical protein
MTKRIIWLEVEYHLLEGPKGSIFRFIPRTEKSAQDIALVAQHNRGILDGSTVSWVLDPEKSLEKLQNTDFVSYGIYIHNALAAFGIAYAHQNNGTIETAIICVDPAHRSKNLPHILTKHALQAMDQTEAVLFYADALTLHDASQKTLESVGCIPVGIQPWFEKIGGSENGTSQETLVRYVRFPKNDPTAWIEEMKTRKLTPNARKMFNLTLEMLKQNLESELDELNSLELIKAS